MKETKLEIEVGEVNIEETGIVVANIALKPSKKIQLSEIRLEYCDRKVNGSIRDNEQLTRFIDCNVNYKVEFPFFKDVNESGVWQISEIRSIAQERRRKEVHLVVKADTKEWSPVVILLPTEVNKHAKTKNNQA